jgi:hypothetical protein
MDLEHRVKTLEHEVKILKNQIQRTLLEIQEQVLTHYYPSLRTEEILIPESMESLPEMPQNGTVSPPMTEVTPPLVRQVSLDEARNIGFTPEDEVLPLLPTASQASHDNLIDLAYWVGDSLVEIGADRTGKLIEIRAKSGRLDDNVKDALLQLMALCDDGAGGVPDKAHVQETIGAFLKLNSLLA